MAAPRWIALLTAVVLLSAACTRPLTVVGSAEPTATLTLDGEPVSLRLTSCGLVNGRLLEALPDGGTEVTLTAHGRLADRRPVAVRVRRGTDMLTPERFELLEVTLGEVDQAIESLVTFRGRDEATGTWTEVDPEAPGARRTVTGGLVEIDGPRLRLATTVSRPSDGRQVILRLDATCPASLELAPGTA